MFLKTFILLQIIGLTLSDTFQVLDVSRNYVMPNATEPKPIRKSEEQVIYMMVTDVTNSSKYVTAFAVEVDKYAQLVIPGCKFLNHYTFYVLITAHVFSRVRVRFRSKKFLA